VIFKFTIQTRDEVEHISGLPIVGTVERSDKNVEIVVRHYPKSGFAESFRSLRSKLEYLAKKESPISILVTSTEPKDGKTFIASNLASIYQLTKKKVVLVDFDLRRPALSKQMGLDGKKGISNYLIGQVSADELIYQHPEFGFDVLPAGMVPPNPNELIRTARTKELLDMLMKRYDYVILDTSPFGLVSDASYLGKMVDTILYIVRNEATNRNFFKYTIKEFKEENEGNIGIVYNDVNLKSGQYGTRQYYGKSTYYYRKGSYYHEGKVENLES
jgi:capsular exopolysaccharide synthesis family protein